MNQQEALKCIGCGVQLQTESPQLPGYVPEHALQKETVICHRCFRIKHYNEMSRVTLDSDAFWQMLNRIGQRECLVVHIVDIFDFEGSVISGIHRFVGTNPVLLVVNKIDLLPKSVNFNKIVNWVRRRLKELGLKVADVALCSAKKRMGFDQVITLINQYRAHKDVFIVGATNVGKSMFINRLIQDYSRLDIEITTSRYPGTTLDFIHIPMDDGTFIIDTPGIVYPNRLTEQVHPSDLQKLLPEVPIKPRIYQLNPRQTLFFGAMARFDFVEGDWQSFTCYVSNSIPVHRTKLERADALYESHKGELLQPPAVDKLRDLPPLVRHSFRVGHGSKQDIMIPGLGWIKANATTGASVEVYAPKGVKVILRDSMI